MAIYHFHVQTISRGEGRSLVSALAYRWALRIRDDRLGECADFRRRRGVVATGVAGFDGEAGVLANACEAAERRRDARIAREIVCALPAELGDAARRVIVADFATAIWRRHHVAVMWALHAPDKDGDNRNHHAHLLLTTRRVEDGRLKEKARELDDPEQSGAHVDAWRADWEDLVNAELARAGSGERIDRRSLADRGEERGPAEHLGPHATRLERLQAGSSTRGARNAAVQSHREELDALDAQLARVESELAQIDPTGASRADAHDVRIIVETGSAPRPRRRAGDRLASIERREARGRATASLRRRRGRRALSVLLRITQQFAGATSRSILDLWRASWAPRPGQANPAHPMTGRTTRREQAPKPAR